MKIDKILGSVAATDSTETITKTIGRGRINGLLFVNENYIDPYITIKLRGKQNGITVIANRIPFSVIETISNYKQGYSPKTAYQSLSEFATNWVNEGENLSDVSQQLANSSRINFAYLDLGFINLNTKDFEIDIEKTGEQFVTGDNEFSVYSVHTNDQPEIYNTYNIVNDLEGRYNNVRELYLYTKNDLYDGSLKRILGQLDFDGDGTFLFDEKSLFASSHLFTNATGIYETNLHLIYAETDPLPSNPYVKIEALDAAECQLLVQGEVAILNEVSDSTVENGRKLVRDIKKLERDDPEKAKAYRHSGIIPKSAEVEEVVSQAEKSNDKNIK